MKAIKRLLVIGAAGVTMALGTATGAYAGVDAVSSMTGSWAKFFHSADSFRVCDTSWDGWNAYVDYEYVRIDGSLQTGAHFVTTGDGTCKDFGHNFGEDRTVNFRACVEIWPYPDLCARWTVGVA
jgi:hypothetical protein